MSTRPTIAPSTLASAAPLTPTSVRRKLRPFSISQAWI